jgi:hypothetical protein
MSELGEGLWNKGNYILDNCSSSSSLGESLASISPIQGRRRRARLPLPLVRQALCCQAGFLLRVFF